jgi:nitrogen fixation NifU-like protein
MEETFYKDLILFHWRNPQNYGKLKKANKRAFLDNPFCGDAISMEAKIEKGKIKEIKFSGKGCIISKASASLITEYAKGKKISEIKNLDKDSILKLLGIELGPTRLKCALLPLNVLKKLIQ